MSDSRQIVALNVGSKRVTMGVFTRSGKNGLALSRYGSRVLDLDPSEESMRLGQMSSAIGELVSELKVKGSTVNYSVSGQSVFIRFIKLPPIDNADVTQLVKFEAQQQVPFPIDEVIWDYHLLPSNGLEQEAVLVAVKADALNSLDDVVESHGLVTGQVDCAVASIYNAYRDSYPDDNDPAMIIDIGAKTTDLIYCEAGRFFTRSISAGGVFITSAIAREFNTSFMEAEQAKVTKGLVSMTNGQTEGMDPEVAALATSIRNAMTRLASEIQRTTNHYRAQMHGSAPVKAYLCGGGASLPYTKEFLEERLGIPVAFFNPLHNVGVGSQVNVDKVAAEAYMLGGIVGTALDAVGRAAINIDLVPTAVGRRREAKRKLPKVIMGVVIAVIGAGIYTVASFMSLERAVAVEKVVGAKEESVQALANKIAKNKTAINDLNGKLAQYELLSLQRYGYSSLLSEFVDTAPSDAFWVTDFSPLTNYNPNNIDGMSGDAIVKDTFATEKASSIVVPATPDASAAAKRPGAGQASAPKRLEVNAILLKGFVRNALGGDSVIQDIRKKIEANGDKSLFTFKKPDGSPLEMRQVLAAGDAKTSNNFVKSFSLVLPLKRPLPVTTQEQQN